MMDLYYILKIAIFILDRGYYWTYSVLIDGTTYFRKPASESFKFGFSKMIQVSPHAGNDVGSQSIKTASTSFEIQFKTYLTIAHITKTMYYHNVQ